MNEEDKEAVYETLVEVSELLYVLEMALSNDSQPTTDTSPYACIAKTIRLKLADATEILQP